MGKLIHRQCACGCGEITSPGNRWINGHHTRGIRKSEDHKRKISLANKGHICSEETKRKMSFSQQGHPVSKKTRKKISISRKGIKFSKEHIKNMSLARLKAHPDDEYCEEWRDRQFRKDCRKDYCENVNCKRNYKLLSDHHINLNPYDCRPRNVMTLCVSCHVILHWKLSGKNKTDYKDYLTIIRKDKIIYIHKKTKKKTILKRSNFY